jgi:hypothetical protein
MQSVLPDSDGMQEGILTEHAKEKGLPTIFKVGNPFL